MTRILPLLVFVTLLMVGCTGRPDVKMASDKLPYLKAAPEIRILYYPTMTINIFRHIFFGACYYRWHCEKVVVHLPFRFVDPLPGVQSRFVAGLMKKLNIDNFRAIRRDSPLSEHPLSPDEASLGIGVVFQFDTKSWQVIQRFQSYAPKPGTGVHYYDLRYSAQGRLFRHGELNLLWKADCQADISFEASSDIPLHELIADENSLIHSKRREAEGICSEQLLEKFFWS